MVDAAMVAAAIVALNNAAALNSLRPPAASPARRHAPPQLAALADADIAAALADEKYAMDISSITAGSEKET